VAGIGLATFFRTTRRAIMSEPTRNRRTDASPYGPQPEGVDEAAGGADSTPFENLPSGEKGPAAECEAQAGRFDPTPGGEKQAP
jgi:hypothetical protein